MEREFKIEIDVNDIYTREGCSWDSKVVVLQHIAKKHNNWNIIFIDNLPQNIHEAIKAGFKTVYVDTNPTDSTDGVNYIQELETMIKSREAIKFVHSFWSNTMKEQGEEPLSLEEAQRYADELLRLT